MTNAMIDFHSHMLPEMDDGSSSVEQSLEMIGTSAEQGVTHIVLTPHFYAGSDNPRHFLQKRDSRMKQLMERLPDGSPKLLLGAEVQYFEGMSTMDALLDMRIEGTRCLLVEMPFTKWSPRMLDDLVDINRRKDFKVILAHVDRYIRMQDMSVMSSLIREGILFQANADFFLRSFFILSKKPFRMLENGWIHLLGSDAHNMTSRAPNLELAARAISQKCGDDALQKIHMLGKQLLSDTAPVKSNAAAVESTV